MIPCLGCETRFAPPAFLDACTLSWPAKKWVLFECPACGHSCHVHLRRGSVALADYAYRRARGFCGADGALEPYSL